MKKLLLFITAIFICGVSIAQTIRWHIGDTVYETTTCNAGESITPPTAPEKFGYSFSEWAPYKARIEYLESTGTQYIDTGVYADFSTFKIEIKALKQKQYSLFGTNDVTQLDFTGSSTGDIEYFRYAPNSNSLLYGTNIVISITEPQLFVLDRGTIYADGVAYSPVASGVTGRTVSSIYLFARNRNGLINDAGKHKIYYCKIWNEGTLVRDFIPVLDKNGTPCMYDKVENKFYYNQGTGQFIAGPVIGE